MIIDLVAGARPNFMKVAALFAVSSQFPSLTLRLVHTGQHYDLAMSDVFLEQLGLPAPASNLAVGSASHAVQTAEIMKRYEQWVESNRPDLCVVVGDVNSTVACALVAAKSGIPVAHVEAGLRSFDRTMPEEINRVLTDSISDLMFATEPSAIANLAREGRPPEQIHLVGHVMIDTLLRMLPYAQEIDIAQKFGIAKHEFAYVTLHRPSNVDDSAVLAEVMEQIRWLAAQIPVLFPLHPRTLNRLRETQSYDALVQQPGLRLVEPLGYIESLAALKNARLVVTDSGGLQEESAALGIPCLTLRENTERPITVQEGKNILIGHDWNRFQQSVARILAHSFDQFSPTIPYWDGKAGVRILRIIETFGSEHQVQS